MKALQRVRIIAATVACGVSLTLSACSGDAESTAPGGGAAETTPAPAPTDEPAELGGRDCLIGDWLADNEFFLTNIRQFGDEIKDVSGQVTVTYGDDGSITTVYDDWLITAVVEGNTSTITREGTDLGQFDATESTISFEDTQVDSKLSVTAGGHAMTIPGEPANYADASYTCSATEATITTPDGTLQLTRR